MFSTTWKVEDIFPGWSRTKLEDWGSSDPRFIEMNAALAAFELGEPLGFGNDTEKMRWAEQSRVVRGSKLMHLDLIHGLFIT